MKNVILGIILATVSVAIVARADHEIPGGSLARLRQSTRELDRSVQYSSLRYNVKNAVSRFAYDVARFVQCAQYGLTDADRGRDRDHDLIPERCEYDLHRAQNSWYSVDRYLYDTNWDYPYIYREYLEVAREMQSLPR